MTFQMMSCVHQMMFLLGIILSFLTSIEALNVLVGVSHSTLANNLPTVREVSALYRKYNIRRAFFYQNDLKTIKAFEGMQVEICVALDNAYLSDMATSQELVDIWFDKYLRPYTKSYIINYIVVGTDAIPGLHNEILPVMKFLRNTLFTNNCTQIKITTLASYRTALDSPYPPSSAVFESTSEPKVKEILDFLSAIASPLMVSVYPYIEFKTQENISLSYANFRSNQVVLEDGIFKYYNLFDAMVDAFYRAMSRINIDNVEVVVGETGWPTCGDGQYTTPKYAGMYNRRFVNHIQSGKGTPFAPDVFMEGYIQSMFNENLRPEGISRCFGIFNVDKTPVYPLFSKTRKITR